MKIVFAGPSIAGLDLSGFDFQLAPPAAHGDIFAAVENGAQVIGLIDGTFDSNLSVWHKEILFALQEGARVLGASSMGALRAAECHLFGMEPVGRIAHGFIDGAYEDDAVVAMLHAPRELGFAALTEPMVDIWATLEAMQGQGLICAAEAEQISQSAQSIYFKDRTLSKVFEALEIGERLLALYEANRVNQKQIDAIELLELVASS